MPSLPDLLGRLIYRDMKGYLPGDILVKVDRASMAVALETRCPLLDHRVVEFGWRLPSHQKVRGGKGKYLLRRVLGRYVPSALFGRPKQGFNVPVGEWLKGPLRDWAEDLLGESQVRRCGFLDAASVRSCWQEHLIGRRDRSRGRHAAECLRRAHRRNDAAISPARRRASRSGARLPPVAGFWHRHVSR